MRTLITVSLLLCGKLLCAQQDTILLDSCTIKKYPHNYQSVSGTDIPEFVKEKLNSLTATDVYRTWCSLGEFPLSNGNKAFFFAINEKNYDCTFSKTNYYIAANDWNNVDPVNQFFLYDVLSMESEEVMKININSAKLVNGQFLQRFGENNTIYSVNDLFQPGFIPAFSLVPGDYWPGIGLYDGPIVSVNWNPEWSSPILWVHPTTAFFPITVPEVKITVAPFDFKGFFSELNRKGFFSSVMTLPYSAIFKNTESVEKGCFELSEVLLLGQLEEAKTVVGEHKKDLG